MTEGRCLAVLQKVGIAAAMYKFVFEAGWVQAAVIGSVGGFIAFFLLSRFILLVVVPLTLTA